MSTPPKGLTRQVVDLVRDAFAGSSWFLQAAAAIDAAGGRAAVFAGVDPHTPEHGHAIVDPPRPGYTRIAGVAGRVRGAFSVTFRLLLPPLDRENPADLDRAADLSDIITADVVRALIAHPLVDAVDITSPIIQLDTSDALNDWYEIGYTLSGRCQP